MLAEGGATDHLPDRLAWSRLPKRPRCTSQMGLATIAAEAPIIPSGRTPGFPKAMLAESPLIEQGERDLTT
eukprot:15443503-Alexandrium_andersonii.AAC.1